MGSEMCIRDSDAAERSVDIPVLQFPLWLAFAAGPGERLDDDDLL